MNAEISCKYCNTVFQTISSLNSHMKKAKYCISIQEKKIFKCEYCEKILSTKQSLLKHKDVCKKKNQEPVSDKEKYEEMNKELIEKDKIIVKVKTQVENYKEQLENSKEQIESYKEQIRDLQDKLDKIANRAIERPTLISNKTTNNLNITSSLDFSNLEKMKDAIENKLSVNHIVDGQKGLAKFMTDTILKDDNGDLLYVCTDTSRSMFRFKDSDGEIKKDPEAKKLISYMVDAGIKGKSVQIAQQWCKDEFENIDITKYQIMDIPQQLILKIDDDNSTFKRELASMTSV